MLFTVFCCYSQTIISIMQHEFIRYNKDAIGRPVIFGMNSWNEVIPLGGGGDKGKPKENRNDHVDEEKMYEDDIENSMRPHWYSLESR